MDAEEEAALGGPDPEGVSLEGRGAGGWGAGAGDGGQSYAETWDARPADEHAARPEGTEPGSEPEPEPEPEEEETYEYTEQQVLEMRAAFEAFDLFRNDSIPVGRLGAVLRALGLNPTEAQLRDAARWLDADPAPARGVVRFKEFLIIAGRALRDPVTVERVLEGFRKLDADAAGAVDRARLADVLTTTGERLYPNEFAAFIKYADPKRRGVVKYEDFVKKMSSGKIKRKKKKKKKRKKGGKKKVRQREPGSVSWSSAIDLRSL